MYLCDSRYGTYGTFWAYSGRLQVYESPCEICDWCWPIAAEGANLWQLWLETIEPADRQLSGVLADWLDDHRDDLLTGATGPDPAARLDLLIHWLREVRCFGRENAPAE